ncbi:MAG TPA: TonB-dependent receptor [Verrucomicrobiae bacterium]|nr:TonB-dependent receptor [Verrucomicrobiae bacterium]
MIKTPITTVAQWFRTKNGGLATARGGQKAVLAVVTLFFVLATQAQEVTKTNIDISELPLEQLLKMDVTILKGHETLSQTPAAISIVTSDDIRRSGAMNIPEALRQVPGMEVARVDASEWAVSARGFNDVFANKLLVLQDGRTVYSPVFSGVFWDVQGAMMEDIDRIEVIRGPGSTVWGANAVNGVINVISKSAKDTQGLLVSAGGGNIDQAFVNARYGGQFGSNVSYRVYGTYMDQDSFPRPNGQEVNNAWQMGRWGAHLDWDASPRDLVTLQGDGYLGAVHQSFNVFDPTSPTLVREVPDRMSVLGGNVLGRWTHTFSDTSELKTQLSYDRTERHAVVFGEKRDTVDLDAQHSFALGERNALTWGLGYRLSSDEMDKNKPADFTPASDTLNLFSGFAQDEVTVFPDKLKFTAGSKIEHNDFTGWDVEPGGRLAWTPDERNTLWASVSRAVRTPSRVEEAVQINEVESTPFGPAVLQVSGNRHFQSEKLMAYETGYRIHPCDKISFDLAAFYNVYDDLRSIEVAPGFPLIPAVLANKLYGDTYGFEATATFAVQPWWRLIPTYSLLKEELHTRNHSTDTTSVRQDEGQDPQQQFSLRSAMDLPRNISLDATLRYVDELPSLRVGSYVTMDARLSWRATKRLELALVGQDLFEPRHAEFRASFVESAAADVPRSFYAKVTWHF